MSYNSGSNRARNFKSASCFALGQFEITRPITPWIVLHSVQLLLIIIIIIIIIIISIIIIIIIFIIIQAVAYNGQSSIERKH